MRSLCPCFSFVVHTTLSLYIRCPGLKDYKILEFFLYLMVHIHNFDNLFWINYHLHFFKWSLNHGPFGGSEATSGQPDYPPLPPKYLVTLYAAVATHQTLWMQVSFQQCCPFLKESVRTSSFLVATTLNRIWEVKERHAH